MVFYNFDYSCFPNVKIIFVGDVNNEDLEMMFSEWLSIYNKKTNFNIIFDLTEIKAPTIVFAYKMARFIEILRKKTVSEVYIYWKNKNENVNSNNILKIFEKHMFKFNYISNK